MVLPLSFALHEHTRNPYVSANYLSPSTAAEALAITEAWRAARALPCRHLRLTV